MPFCERFPTARGFPAIRPAIKATDISKQTRSAFAKAGLPTMALKKEFAEVSRRSSSLAGRLMRQLSCTQQGEPHRRRFLLRHLRGWERTRVDIRTNRQILADGSGRRCVCPTPDPPHWTVFVSGRQLTTAALRQLKLLQAYRVIAVSVSAAGRTFPAAPDDAQRAQGDTAVSALINNGYLSRDGHQRW